MKFNIFDRREQKMKKLATLVSAADDRSLKAVLEQGGTEEVALLLRLVPIARMNPLMQVVPLDKIRGAFSRLRGGAHAHDGVTDQGIAALVALLTTSFSEREGPRIDEIAIGKDGATDLDRPVCVRALDFAVKVLGGED